MLKLFSFLIIILFTNSLYASTSACEYGLLTDKALKVITAIGADTNKIKLYESYSGNKRVVLIEKKYFQKSQYGHHLLEQLQSNDSRASLHENVVIVGEDPQKNLVQQDSTSKQVKSALKSYFPNISLAILIAGAFIDDLIGYMPHGMSNFYLENSRLYWETLGIFIAGNVLYQYFDFSALGPIKPYDDTEAKDDPMDSFTRAIRINSDLSFIVEPDLSIEDTPEFVNTLEQKIVEISDGLESLKTKIETVDDKHKPFKKKQFKYITSLSKQLNKVQTNLEKNNESFSIEGNKLDGTQNQLRQKKKDRRELKLNVRERSTVEDINESIEELGEEVDSFKEEMLSIAEKIFTLDEDLSSIEGDMESIHESYADMFEDDDFTTSFSISFGKSDVDDEFMDTEESSFESNPEPDLDKLTVSTEIINRKSQPLKELPLRAVKLVQDNMWNIFFASLLVPLSFEFLTKFQPNIINPFESNQLSFHDYKDLITNTPLIVSTLAYASASMGFKASDILSNLVSKSHQSDDVTSQLKGVTAKITALYTSVIIIDGDFLEPIQEHLSNNNWREVPLTENEDENLDNSDNLAEQI